MATAFASRRKNTILIAGGLAAGFMNGLLGAGGGILIVFVMGAVLSSKKDMPEGALAPDKRDIFANALAAMLPVTAVSVISYALRGNLHANGAEVYIFPAIIGGLGGAWLLDKLRFDTVRRLFSLIVIISGIAMLLKD